MSDNVLDSAGRVAVFSDGSTAIAYDRDHVRAILEDAGRTLKLLGQRGCWPQGHGAQWPEIPQDFWTAYNANEPDQPWPRPSKAAIDRLDKILPLLNIIQDPTKRYVTAQRMIVHPIREKPIKSYGRIACDLGISKAHAKNLHDSALGDIAWHLTFSKADE